MKIWAHTLVKNEERYLWYSVMSAIDHVDKVLLWDTGSTDKTLEVIKEIRNAVGDKVSFKQVGEVDIEEFTKVRQKMLEETESDWFMILDGDEVWWEDSIRRVTDTIRQEGDRLESIVNPYYNIVGDIYHYQEEQAGRYQIDGRRGHLTIRVMSRKIPGLHLERPHGTEGFFDKNGKLVQERSRTKRKFVDACYLHFTHVVRSFGRQKDLAVPKRDIKLKHEVGISFPADFYYPEVFFRPRPSWIYTPWEKLSGSGYLKALVQTPLRRVKRRAIYGRSGY